MPKLKGILSNQAIRATFKGEVHRARVLRSGRIRYDGALYDSPSTAAGVAVGRRHGLDGWYFWHYKNDKGEWVKLNELRKGE